MTFFRPESVDSMIWASSPMPAMTTKRSWPSSKAQVTMSMALRRPCRARRMAASVSKGMERLRARRLPVPAGMRAMGISVPASWEETARTVPSPPATMTRSTPASRARRVMERPGSSGVVSSQTVGSQPAARTSAATRRRRSERSSNLVGL